VGPATAYAALAVGKQVDAVIMFQPFTQLCQLNKSCATVIDMTAGEGPDAVRAMNGASVPFVMRREMADSNQALVQAFYAAMRDDRPGSTTPPISRSWSRSTRP
jgi:ABC-type nitrate/sulfonate/bicarbonate transport system substrate-binding protein